MDRTSCQISDSVGQLLTKQVAHEIKNYILYSSFMNYFSLQGLDDLADYYEKRAHEEKLHHEWIREYCNNADYRLIYPAVEMNPEQEIKSYTDPFDATIEREIETTNMLYVIYDTAKEEGDQMTASWLYEKLIKEQIEEESVSRMAASIMEQSGDIFNKAKKVLKLLNS